ncbi:hypothetical protein Daus18300_001460 [Diaporthe australafricana]|uniref:Uncharacterized protein n=1 Tax=Diaporthe australafricana TaxID=127596 RepID=A0ABR3XVS3_9PEZI
MPQGLKREVPDSSPEASQEQIKRPRLSNSDMPYEAPAMDNPGSVPSSIGDMAIPIIQQAAAPPQQMPPPPIQAAPLVPVHEHLAQSRIIAWVLFRPADAYYDILGLANGTPLYDVLERAWLNMTLLAHPFRCTLPNALQAFHRVNDAYCWIRAHLGWAQPYVPPPPQTPVAQGASNAPQAAFIAAFPGGGTVMVPQQPWDNRGTQHAPQ